MSRGEKHGTPVRRGPIPRKRGVRTETKNPSENYIASDQSRYESENNGQEKADVSNEEWTGSNVVLGLQEIPVSDQGFDQREQEKDAVHEVDVDHQSGDKAK